MADNAAQWSEDDGLRFAQAVAIDAKSPLEKRPLYRPLPPATAFPVDALGPLAPAALAIHHRTQAPIAICSQSVLAAATLAAQAQRDIILPGGGRKPLTGFFVSVAESGERKSSVDRIALVAVYEIEDELRQLAEGERNGYLNAKAVWDASRERAKRENRGDATAMRLAFDATGPEPAPPPHPMLLIADPTPEALILHLAGRPMAGVFTAEGGLLMGGAAFNQEAAMRTAALFNTLWDGDPVRRLRVITGPAYLPGRRCTGHIMMQPVVADRLFGDPMLEGIGLTARMLIVAPDSTAGTRFYRDPPATAVTALDAYNRRLRHLLKRAPSTRPDMPDALDPPPMRLATDAAVEWRAFHDLCEGAIGAGGALATIRAFGAKLPEHAGRLAGVLTLYDDPDAMEVAAWAMRFGVALATFYASEMLRLHGGALVSPELRLAQQLLAWWQVQPTGALHLATIYQRGPNAVRDAKTARKAVQVLEDHGWVASLTPGTEIDGAPRREGWRLLP